MGTWAVLVTSGSKGSQFLKRAGARCPRCSPGERPGEPGHPRLPGAPGTVASELLSGEPLSRSLVGPVARPRAIPAWSKPSSFYLKCMCINLRKSDEVCYCYRIIGGEEREGKEDGGGREKWRERGEKGKKLVSKIKMLRL